MGEVNARKYLCALTGYYRILMSLNTVNIISVIPKIEIKVPERARARDSVQMKRRWYFVMILHCHNDLC